MLSYKVSWNLHLGIQPKSLEDSDFIVLYDKHSLDWFVLKLIICNFSQVTLRFAHGLEKAVSQQQGGYQFFETLLYFSLKWCYLNSWDCLYSGYNLV